MNKEQKQEVIEALKEKFSQYSNFYITNTESLSVAQINKLRKHCFDKQVEMRVAKNTLIRKALESLDSEKYSGVYDSLQNVTALMFSESPKDPAVIISSFRKEARGEKPVLKAAFLNGDIFIGDNQLINLTKIKTKNELIGEVIGLLMSPIQRVIGALQNRPEGEAVSEVKEETKAPAAEVIAEETPKAEVKAEEAPKAESKVEEAPKAEETPKAEVKAEEAPKAESKVKEAPKAEETPKAEVKAEETPKAEVKAKEAPKAEAKADEAPKAEVKADEAPKAESKVEEAPKAEETPKAEVKAEEAPKAEETPKAEEKAEETPKAEAKVDEAPKAEVKADEAPKGEKPAEPTAE